MVHQMKLVMGHGGKTLWEHQQKAVSEAARRRSYAFFMEMGTGKTASAITTLRNWCVGSNRFLNTLVLCPPAVIHQWAGEVENWSKMGGFTVPLTGTGPRRFKQVQETLSKGKPFIFITNYETLLMKNVFAQLMSANLDVVIADESHKIKNPTAKRTKAAVALAKTAEKKLILTGTPILNNPMDIFSQYQFMDGGQSFGDNFFVFRARYFEDKNIGMRGTRHYFPNWQPRAERMDDYKEVVSKSSIRVEKKDCMDLPPLLRKTEYVEMSPEQKRAYNEMKEDFITYVDEKASVASIALTKILKMQQILSGYITVQADDEEDPETVEFKNPRLDRMKEILEELTPNHKVIVWSCFKKNYEVIGKALEKMGIKYTTLYGGMSERARQNNIDEFRGDDSCRVIIANQKAGGVGLNLIEASYSLYFSRSYSLEDDLQSEARNYRGGSEIHDKVTRIDLVCKDTIDETILTALKNKQNLAENILQIRNELKGK